MAKKKMTYFEAIAFLQHNDNKSVSSKAANITIHTVKDFKFWAHIASYSTEAKELYTKMCTTTDWTECGRI